MKKTMNIFLQLFMFSIKLYYKFSKIVSQQMTRDTQTENI